MKSYAVARNEAIYIAVSVFPLLYSFPILYFFPRRNKNKLQIMTGSYYIQSQVN